MKERISLLPRALHRLYAKTGGYFWVPCPLCGRESGGHEWKDRDGKSSVLRYGNEGEGICPACTRAGLGT